MNPTPIIIAALWVAAFVTACHGAWRAACVLGGIAFAVTILLAP